MLNFSSRSLGGVFNSSLFSRYAKLPSLGRILHGWLSYKDFECCSLRGVVRKGERPSCEALEKVPDPCPLPCTPSEWSTHATPLQPQLPTILSPSFHILFFSAAPLFKLTSFSTTSHTPQNHPTYHTRRSFCRWRSSTVLTLTVRRSATPLLQPTRPHPTSSLRTTSLIAASTGLTRIESSGVSLDRLQLNFFLELALLNICRSETSPLALSLRSITGGGVRTFRQ